MSLLRGFKGTDTKCSQRYRNISDLFPVCVQRVSGEVSREAAPTRCWGALQHPALGSGKHTQVFGRNAKPAFALLGLWRPSEKRDLTRAPSFVWRT